MKRLYRSRSNKVVAGVVGGVGEYYDIDPVLLRLGWLLIVVFTGFVPGIIAYAFAAIIMPEHPGSRAAEKKSAPQEKKEESDARE